MGLWLIMALISSRRDQSRGARAHQEASGGSHGLIDGSSTAHRRLIRFRQGPPTLALALAMTSSSTASGKTSVATRQLSAVAFDDSLPGGESSSYARANPQRIA